MRRSTMEQSEYEYSVGILLLASWDIWNMYKCLLMISAIRHYYVRDNIQQSVLIHENMAWVENMTT